MCGEHSPASDALRTSWTIQEEASSVGFDWPDITGVFNKVEEELGEIRHAWNAGDPEHARRELGDLLFATVNLARFLDTDPSAELERANQRFEQRFNMLKEDLREEGRAMERCTLEELDVVWERVKKRIGEVEKNSA